MTRSWRDARSNALSRMSALIISKQLMLSFHLVLLCARFIRSYSELRRGSGSAIWMKLAEAMPAAWLGGRPISQSRLGFICPICDAVVT